MADVFGLLGLSSVVDAVDYTVSGVTKSEISRQAGSDLEARLRSYVPGKYRITAKDVIVSATLELGGECVTCLRPGAHVEVVEVVYRPYEQRLRGRIEEGWISLLNTEDGSCWVSKVKHRSERSQKSPQKCRGASESVKLRSAVKPVSVDLHSPEEKFIVDVDAIADNHVDLLNLDNTEALAAECPLATSTFQDDMLRINCISTPEPMQASTTSLLDAPLSEAVQANTIVPLDDLESTDLATIWERRPWDYSPTSTMPKLQPPPARPAFGAEPTITPHLSEEMSDLIVWEDIGRLDVEAESNAAYTGKIPPVPRGISFFDPMEILR